MKRTPTTRPIKTIEVFEPIYDDYAMIICPDQRIQFENKAAKPGVTAVRIIRNKH